MPLTHLKGRNLPENGTEGGVAVTLCQYGTEPDEGVKLRVDER